MAITNLSFMVIADGKIEGRFTTDGTALPNTTGTIAAPSAPPANTVITVVSTAALQVGDLVKIDGAGVAGIPVIGGVNQLPNATDLNVQGTRISTAIAAQPVTVLPYLFVKHNVKRITLMNLTSGVSWEWTRKMGYGAAMVIDAAGSKTFTATDGFYRRGSNVYLHPSMYAINSTYTFSMDY